jgi:flagellar protein FlbD
MISLTRLDDTTIVLNALLIERIEETPDTVITLTTGRKVVVLESSDEVIKRSVGYLQDLRGGDDDGAGVTNVAQLGRVTK